MLDPQEMCCYAVLREAYSSMCRPTTRMCIAPMGKGSSLRQEWQPAPVMAPANGGHHSAALVCGTCCARKCPVPCRSHALLMTHQLLPAGPDPAGHSHCLGRPQLLPPLPEQSADCSTHSVHCSRGCRGLESG